ncbi:UNVERIFIED_CONTAM: hypothetical protein Scaly_0597800 [Sesamum calycinum]|uniref:Reverse transcriptase zinc-binding domain-containing protein n=1 Tax=Sesamum calycinum TaxID=2727403 RepID=A0AAW2RS79_9LAMI
MILLSWNCQGLGSPCTVHALGELLRTHKPSWFSWRRPSARKTASKLSKESSIYLVVVLSLKVAVGVSHYYGTNHFQFNSRVLGIITSMLLFTRNQRLRLGGSRVFMDLQMWLVVSALGTFSRPLRISHAGVERHFFSIDVYDLGFEGDPFTWCNRHPEPDTIFERLDRACADSEWHHKFPNTVVRHIPTTSSDHVVLSIDTENNHKPARPKHRPFRFEASWTSSADYEQVIREGWNAWAGNGQVSLAERQRGCAARLQAWYNSNGSHSSNDRSAFGRRTLRISVCSLFRPQANLRNQRSGRILNNCCPKKRFIGNNGEEIRDHIETYFGEIFRSRNPSEEELEKGTEAISGRLSEQLRQELSQPYTAEEISKALSQMAPLKSPGPDGMPPFFFQKYWHIVKTDVISATLALLNELILPLAAFVPGRLITDNVLLAFEVNHYLNTKKWGEKGHMALKLDISKAYDKIEWKFLEKVLRLLALYCRGKSGEEGCNWCGFVFLEVLDNFGRAAGQEINFAKSSVVFSLVGKTRRSVFQSIRDRVWNRINGWNERNLSQAGKEILIKVVAQAIPTYAMGCFRLPISLIKELQSMVANFWWHNGETRKLTGSAGGNSASPKFKAGWVFVTFKHLIWLCFPNNCGGSFRSRIVYFAEFFERDISQRTCSFGTGWTKSFLHLAQYPGGPTGVESRSPSRAVLARRYRCYPRYSPQPHRWGGLSIWHHTHNGLFSVRSAYHVALSLAHQPLPCSSNLASPVWKTIWKANVPSKIRVFIWKVAHNALPTGRNLLQKLRFEPLACPLCCSEDEDVEHVFLRCPFARQVWALSHLPGHLSRFFPLIRVVGLNTLLNLCLLRTLIDSLLFVG